MENSRKAQPFDLVDWVEEEEEGLVGLGARRRTVGGGSGYDSVSVVNWMVSAMTENVPQTEKCWRMASLDVVYFRLPVPKWPLF